MCFVKWNFKKTEMYSKSFWSSYNVDNNTAKLLSMFKAVKWMLLLCHPLIRFGVTSTLLVGCQF